MSDGPETVDIGRFLSDPTSSEAIEDCERLAHTLMKTSCLIVKDSRVSQEASDSFLNMMEDYYNLPHEIKMKDVHPELKYQLGATPEFTELPRDHGEKIKTLSTENAAHIPQGPDPKWRYFWRIGSRPKTTSFPELNAPPVIPESFPQWSETMDRWGTLMHAAIVVVAEMVAVGLGLPKDTFLKLVENGPHLLAPTGSDLARFNQVGTIFAGFHYDLNFLTIHGKSRFPGLFIWTREGSRIPVRVPDGCLLVQAGKQMEWLTGGKITAGFHEVIVSSDTTSAIERAKQRGRPIWRVSSTLFFHIASDNELKPLDKFATKETLEVYPPTLAGNQVSDELAKIKLGIQKE